MSKNALKEIRESLMISKAELARKANISLVTIGRIEKGKPCRLETQRKIVLALGYKISDKSKVFDDDMESFISDNSGRRSDIDRRQLKYSAHIPERRSCKERRGGFDRRLKLRTSK